MTKSPESKPTTRPIKRRRGLRLSLRGGLAILLLLTTALSWPLIQTRASLFSTPAPALSAGAANSSPPADTPLNAGASTPDSIEPDPTQTTLPTATSEPAQIPDITATPTNARDGAGEQTKGYWILSLREGVDTHLFAFHPQYLPLTRLTTGSWDDLTPTISPDGPGCRVCIQPDGTVGHLSHGPG